MTPVIYQYQPVNIRYACANDNTRSFRVWYQLDVYCFEKKKTDKENQGLFLSRMDHGFVILSTWLRFIRRTVIILQVFRWKHDKFGIPRRGHFILHGKFIDGVNLTRASSEETCFGQFIVHKLQLSLKEDSIFGKWPRLILRLPKITNFDFQ